MGKEQQRPQPPEIPIPLEVQFDNVPELLQSRNQWVLWQYRVIDGELKKPPVSPKTGRHASVTNPSTWGSFQEVTRAYEYGTFAGIGFMLTTGIVGIDIDHCFRDGTLTQEAEEIITMLPTYRERSPSGEGMRLFLQEVTLPGAYRRAGNIELYQDRRYLTVTGQTVTGSPAILSSDQIKLNTVYQKIFHTQQERKKESTGGGYGRFPLDESLTYEQILKIAYDAKNGEKFRRYYEGDPSVWEAEGKTQSQADFILCLYLLRLTNGDEAKTDFLFRRSGLIRDKWDSPRGNTTYGAMTIENAKKVLR